MSVAIAAGFYFDNLTSVQADTVASGNSQAVVANQDSQTNVNSQSVALGSAAKTAESTAPAQVSAPASTAATSTSSQESTALQVNQTTDGTTQVTDDNYAQNVSLNMYVQNKNNNRAQIFANGHQVVGINGSFELTEGQLTKYSSITIGTITQERPGQDNKLNIPVLVRTQMHPITITQGKNKNVKFAEIHLDKDDFGNVILTLQNINRDVIFKGEKKFTFDIKTALDLNHAADASAYEGTSYPQTVIFTYKAKGKGANIFWATVKALERQVVNPNPNLKKNTSNAEGVFSVYGDYVNSKQFNSFRDEPLQAQPATLPDNYQWSLNLKGDRGIKDIQLSGGAPLDILFDLHDPDPKTSRFLNNGTVPLWEKISSIQAEDGLSLSALKKQQESQQYEGLLWSRQSDGSINLWFNWSREHLHRDWIKALEAKYGSSSKSSQDIDPTKVSPQEYFNCLKNYFEKSLYSTLPGIKAKQFAEENANAYYHFLGDNPLTWYQEVHVISYDPETPNHITVISYDPKNLNKVKDSKSVKTNPNKLNVQGHSFIKVHFIDSTSNAEKLYSAEVLDPLITDGETMTAWQGESSSVNFPKLSGYDIVDDDQQINTLKKKWNNDGEKPYTVLKTTSAQITFPKNEGDVDDYIIFVKPHTNTINFTFVDDDNKDKDGKPQPIKDAPVESVTKPTGSTVAFLPPSLEERGYLLSKGFTINYNSNNGKPAFETDQNGNAIIHLHHKKRTSSESKTITRTVNVTDPHTGLKTTKVTIHYERTATIDDVTGNVTYSAWTPVDATKTGFDAFNIPAVAGYTPEIKSGTEDELKPLVPTQDQITNWKDQTVDIDYMANDQSMTIDYVDENGDPIDGGHFVVSGKTNQTVDTNAKIPTGWVLVKGQTDAPATITFGGTPTANIKITIEHGTTNVPHDNPVKPGAKTPTGKVINGAHQDDLNQAITRTINITKPGQKPQTITQVAKIFRDATVDDVTGEVTYGAWSTSSWDNFKPAAIDGYTVSQSDVAQTAVTSDTKPVTINITYTANNQTGKIVYQDVDNNNTEVGYTDLTGKTDADVTITPRIPAGYDQVAGQTIPATEKATADGIATVTVKVQHHKITVRPGQEPKPGDKIPGNKNKKPGDGTPNIDVSYETLHRNMTRTINVTDPHSGLKTTKVTIHYEREATIDDVTGDVTYSNWAVVDGSDAGFKKFDIPAVAGYTSEIKSGSADELNALTPTQDQITNWTGQTVDIAYTANDQTMHITYIDKDGKAVDGGSFTVTGKTDQTVDTNAKIPAGWVLSQGQMDAPKTITFGGTPTADITITVEHGKTNVLHNNPVKLGDKTPSGRVINGAHDEDLNQTITRKVTIHEPDKAANTITQVAKIFRDATVDDVTGEVTYGAWSTDATDWTEFDAPVHAGYTVSQPKVAAVTVANGQKDVNIDIIYSANDQTGKIVYVDVDSKNAEVGHTDLTGKTGADVTITPQIPAGYDQVAGQNIPATEKATADGIATVTVKVNHHKITVNPGDEPKPGDKKPGNPDKKPGDGTTKTDVTYDELHRNMTRTVTINDPHSHNN